MSVLEPWPIWNQLRDHAVEGADENRSNNCGPECVAEVLEYVTGYEEYADSIVDREYGGEHDGYTNVPHLAHYLETECHIPVTVHQCQAGEAWQHISNAVAHGCACIGLFYANWRARTGGHFMVIFGRTGQYAAISNPWGGIDELLTEQQFASGWNGYLIVCRRKRALDVVDAAALG